MNKQSLTATHKHLPMNPDRQHGLLWHELRASTPSDRQQALNFWGLDTLPKWGQLFEYNGGPVSFVGWHDDDCVAFFDLLGDKSVVHFRHWSKLTPC